MKYATSILIAAFAATNVLAHGVITEVQGANGVNLPGLSVADGTPRDCPTPGCGSEADTSIIRNKELGTSKASALGRTNGGGPVDAAKMVAMFMDGAGGNSSSTKAARALHAENKARYAKLAIRASNGGTKTPKGTSETGVKAATGAASDGMPTTADDGTLTMTFHQDAEVTQNVPGIGIGGLSGATTTDFPVAIQMPAGMTCQGSVGGAENVCVARLQNSALAGPFGGSVAFTQSSAAKKRAIEYNLAKKRFARGLESSQ
ncbi:hypothetical protein KJ359_012922 [Pestalotiopsis sp. 9143b]|nr:hypothetical protein KJ359_012922 [Pestalotiopsis sp. 9143b]